MEILDGIVKIPEVPGKICLQKKRDRINVLYELRREYNPARKCTVPTRVMIGQQIRTKPGWMVPNENYERYFPEAMAKMTEEEQEAAAEYAEARGEFRMLQALFDQMFYEFQIMARRNPHEVVNAYKVARINKVLEPLLKMMEGKKYAAFLETIEEPETKTIDGEERLTGRNYSDVSLLLTQYKGAIGRHAISD